MIPSASIECHHCDQPMVVVPPMIGQVKPPGGEIPKVDLPNVPEGARLVEATVVGFGDEDKYVVECPECGRENVVESL